MFHIIVSYNYVYYFTLQFMYVYGMYSYMYCILHNGISDDIYVRYYA